MRESSSPQQPHPSCTVLGQFSTLTQSTIDGRGNSDDTKRHACKRMGNDTPAAAAAAQGGTTAGAGAALPAAMPPLAASRTAASSCIACDFMCSSRKEL